MQTNISKEYNELLKMADASTNDDTVIVKVPVQKLDSENKNGRIYSASTAAKALQEATNQLSEKDIQDISDTIESSLSEDNKLMRKIQKTDHDEKNQEEEIQGIIDPVTGNILPIDDENSGIDYITDSFDDLVKSWESDNYSFKDLDLTMDVVSKSIKSNVQVEDISDNDIKDLYALAIKVKNGEEFSYYKAMPDKIKQYIDNSIAHSNVDLGKFVGNGRNYLAKTLLDEIVSDAIMETTYIDINKSIKELDTIFSYSSFIDKLIKVFEIKYIEDAKKLEELGTEDAIQKATQLRDISNAFTQSYTFTDMLEKYKLGKIRVKKIQVEKFDRTCREFLQKYQDTKLVINNIQTVVPVLNRHVDKSIDMNIVKEFICVFINYTRNMSPDNISDHIFMYFFIKNILGLDYYTKTGDVDAEFSDTLIQNINTFLYAIIDRKEQKKEEKPNG